MRASDSRENLLVRKMEAFVRLSDDDTAALDKIWNRTRHAVSVQSDIIGEGDPPRVIRVLLSGWACRYKSLADGRRQITGFFLPGDIFDLNSFVLKKMDHSIRALSPVRYVSLSPVEFEKLTFDRPRIMQALWWETLVSAAIQREWTVNLGQRSALERLAHLLCELHVRLKVIGLVLNDTFDFPVTQLELADALGMTAVHVSRTLKTLRSRDLIRLEDRQLQILDFRELCHIAMFDANYLHLDGRVSFPEAKADCG
jgi:CRP-like cAMP-binding protein